MSDPDPELEVEVRRAEPDFWLASRFVPEPKRRAALVALYAVHMDLGKVAQNAVNPLAGEIRLAWWGEEAQALFTSDRSLGHPALNALRGVEGLSQAALETMIEARHAELEPKPFLDEAQLLTYLDGIYGGLMEAAADISAPREKAKVTEAARAYGWGRLLRDRPLWRARGRDWTPTAWGEATEEEVLAHVRHRIDDALKSVEAASFPINALPAIAPAALARVYAQGRGPSPLEKRIRLLAASIRGRL